MNIDQLQLVKKTDTSKIIFQLLANSRPISNETNIESFKTFLKNRGFKINNDDFYKVFDELEYCGVGSFSHAQPDKFIWKFNLRDVSEQIIYPNKKVDIRIETDIEDESQPEQTERNPVTEERKVEPMKKKRPGRPPGAKNKPKDMETVVPRRPGVISQEVIRTREVLFFFKTKRGNMVPLSLEDAEDLINQVEQVKSQLAG